VSDTDRPIKILIVDLVGLAFNKAGSPDPSAVKDHIIAHGCRFHMGPIAPRKTYDKTVHFFYQPLLSREADILAVTHAGQYDAVIAAATRIPAESIFNLGGVRIGAGTGNMASHSWGGGSGRGGVAPLMNTPSFNSRATAQMVFKALLAVRPDLPMQQLHQRSASGRFDTGRDLSQFPTHKLEGQTLAVIGYGNIGREVAKLGTAFGMRVRVHARARHREWIESEGFAYTATPAEAATGSDVLSVHTGLGPFDAKTKRFANQGLIDWSVLSRLARNSVVINYDRGECIDAGSLRRALRAGVVGHAAIDADLFSTKGKLSGPLVPYMPLAKLFPGRVHLLPHAAADTDHTSRVDGAKQAVDQILSSIRTKRVVNLVGDLPAGYVNAGAVTKPGIGRVSAETMQSFASDTDLRSAVHRCATLLAERAQSSSTVLNSPRDFVLHANRLMAALRKAGIEGPFGDET
jgi:lactate dehydrogenase-like 2-hydroxyacid dehydrogenase